MSRLFSRWLSLLLASLLLAGSALAAPATAPPVPLLWKVSGHDGATVYLLGSFHLLRPDDYPLAPEVDAALCVPAASCSNYRPSRCNRLNWRRRCCRRPPATMAAPCARI